MWDHRLNETKQVYILCSEIKCILYENSQSHVYDMQQIFPVKDVIPQLKMSMLSKQQELVETECQGKPKLRTFIMFRDFQTLPPHVGKPLSFIERRTISKLRLGILPIRLETVRYLKPVVPENQRL